MKQAARDIVVRAECVLYPIVKVTVERVRSERPPFSHYLLCLLSGGSTLGLRVEAGGVMYWQRFWRVPEFGFTMGRWCLQQDEAEMTVVGRSEMR